ncbi:MAG: hypothetical protein HHJ13_03245 [Phycicoccus sp.]|nr:hypothetical protein [Phycicoccus sp.]
MATKEKAGWYYVGNAELRYMDADGWTDQYKPIEDRRAVATPLNDESADVPKPEVTPTKRRPGRRASALAIAVCAGLVAVGVSGGQLNSDTLHGWGSWASEQVGRVSGKSSPQPSAIQTAVVDAKVKVPAKVKPTSAVVATPAATKVAAPPAVVVPVVRKTPVTPQPSSTWNGGGYTKADYALRVAEIPMWVGYIRGDIGAGSAAFVDLTALGSTFDAIGFMPAPPGVDPAWWSASTTTLSQSSRQAAAEWAKGDQNAALSRFEVIVKNSNTLITKVNAAFGLTIPTSKTSA